MKSNVTTITAMLEEDAEYIIPHFQRPYAWRAEQQWSPLWDDIRNVADNIGNAQSPDAVPPHFMGPLVLQERANGNDRRSYIVVDGQQRMATMLIMMKAFADASKECDLGHQHFEFMNHIWNMDKDGEPIPKVRHLHKRNLSEMRAVLGDYSGNTDLNGRISYCHDYFRTRAVEYLRHSEDPEEACNNLLHVLNHKLETAVLLLDSNEQPNKVFETLNARGEPLRQAELIKNTIMYEGNVVENEDLAHQLWNQELDHPHFGKEENQENLDQFFADWLTSINRRKIAQGRAATEFRNHLHSMKTRGRSIHWVAQTLTEAARIYRQVQEREFRETVPSSNRLLDLRAEALMPLILWLWNKDNEFTLSDRQAVLRMIESYIIRRVLTNMALSESMTSNVIGMMNRLQAGLNNGEPVQDATYQWLSQTKNEVNRWPTDQEVFARLSENPHEMAPQRRDLVLNAIENRLRIDQGLAPLTKKLRTTTIIPKGEVGLTNYPIPEGRMSPTRHQRRENALGQLGNFTLISRTMRKKQNEAPWTEKRDHLEDNSDVLLTKAMLQPRKGDFTEQDISNRSKWMAGLCLEIWPYEKA